MRLFTILIEFEDRSVGIDQFKGESPTDALTEFVEKSECLTEYDRSKILEVIDNRRKRGILLIHIADKLKGFWTIDFGLDLSNIPELATIYGGYVVQTDPDGPVRG